MSIEIGNRVATVETVGRAPYRSTLRREGAVVELGEGRVRVRWDRAGYLSWETGGFVMHDKRKPLRTWMRLAAVEVLP